MKNILNVVADILTLVALTIAGVGHILPWFRPSSWPNPPLDENLLNFQAWHAARSGLALGVLAVLIGLSLAINWGAVMRRLLTLGMFLSAFVALAFEVLTQSPYHFTDAHKAVAQTAFRFNDGFLVALIPTCFAVFFCLVRMIWTMPPTRKRPEPVLAMPAYPDTSPAEAPPSAGRYPEVRA
jgi:hypothetical protein